MSRIGKKAIQIPKDVSVNLQNQKLIVKGKYGSLENSFLNLVNILISKEEIVLSRINEEKTSKSYHGLARVLIQNMILGVTQKFTKILIAEGVGYKFQIEKKNLVLSMGFSHLINISIPEDITVKLETPTKLSIIGIDKEKVGLLAAKVRSIRPPEPYKGKGILYEGEKILRKAGKTGK